MSLISLVERPLPSPPEPSTDSQVQAEVDDLWAKARHFRDLAWCATTQDQYARHVENFLGFCDRLSLDARSPDTVALYMASRAEAVTPGTVEHELAAIQSLHTRWRLPSLRKNKFVRMVFVGIRRERGIKAHPKTAIRAADLKRLLTALPSSNRGVRDRALLLLGWTGAFRRSEIAAIEVEDLCWVPEGLKVQLRRSKTDQVAKGRLVGIPAGNAPELCPLEAVRRWLEVAAITTGPLFRSVDRHDRIRKTRLSGAAVASIIKQAVRQAGLDPTNYSGHSLRSGLVTEAAAHGVRERDIMRHTAHRSTRQVRRYIREEGLFFGNPATGLLT
jgi:integrase